MTTELLVTALTCLTSLIGVLIGQVRTQSLIKYRLDIMEKKLERHSDFTERLTICEQKIKSFHYRLDDLQKEVG